MSEQQKKEINNWQPKSSVANDLKKKIQMRTRQNNVSAAKQAIAKPMGKKLTIQQKSGIQNKKKLEKNTNKLSQNNGVKPKIQSSPASKQATGSKPISKSIPKRSINTRDIKIFSKNFYTPLPLFKRLNSRRFLSLDIDTDKIRYISAKKSGDLIQVESWGTQRLPAEISNRFKALQVALENLKQKVYKNGTEVRVSIFSTDFLIKHEVFPYMKKKEELERAILFKFRDEIKHYKDEKFSWGYDILEEFEEQGVKKVHVQVAFAPWEAVNRYVYIFERLRLPVSQLIPRPAALIAAYDYTVETKKSDLLINIAYEFTQILYLKNGTLEYIRNLGIGSKNLEFSIHNENNSISMDKKSNQSDMPSGDADDGSILKKRLLEKLKDLKTKQNPVLHTFFSEILRSIAFIQGNNRNNFIDRIFLTGYGIQKESLIPYLKTRLNIPIFVVFPKLSDRSIHEQLKFGEFFTTFGTILQKYKGFNLLPKKFKERATYKKLGQWLYLIIFLTTIIAGYTSFIQYKLYKRQASFVEQKEREYTALNPYEQSYKQLAKLIGNLKKENASLKDRVEAQPPMLEMMRLISNLTPKKIRLDDFVFRKQNAGGKMTNKNAAKSMVKYAVSIEGEIDGDFVNGDVALINFITSLDNLKFFKEIKVDHKERNQEKKIITFGLTFKF